MHGHSIADHDVKRKRAIKSKHMERKPYACFLEESQYQEHPCAGCLLARIELAHLPYAGQDATVTSQQAGYQAYKLQEQQTLEAEVCKLLALEYA
jgi:hypothetical protein